MSIKPFCCLLQTLQSQAIEISLRLNRISLVDIDVHVSSEHFKEFLQIIVSIWTPMNIIFNTFNSQFDAVFDCCQTKFIGFLNESFEFFFLIALIHERGQWFNHSCNRLESIAVVFIDSFNVWYKEIECYFIADIVACDRRKGQSAILFANARGWADCFIQISANENEDYFSHSQAFYSTENTHFERSHGFVVQPNACKMISFSDAIVVSK